MVLWITPLIRKGYYSREHRRFWIQEESCGDQENYFHKRSYKKDTSFRFLIFFWLYWESSFVRIPFKFNILNITKAKTYVNLTRRQAGVTGKNSHRNSEILYICSKILPKTGKYITLIRNIFLFRVKDFTVIIISDLRKGRKEPCLNMFLNLKA